MDGKKEIVKILNSMSGRYSGYEIFSDWIRCLALSIEQSTHLIRNKENIAGFSIPDRTISTAFLAN